MSLLAVKYFIFIPLIILWLRMPRQKPLWLKLLGAQLMIAATVELVGLGLAQKGISNHWLFNVYMVLDYALMATMMLYAQPQTNISKGFFAAGLTVFVAAFAFHLFGGKSFLQFASLPLIVGGFMLAAQAMLALYTMTTHSDQSLHKRGAFWIITSVLVYYLCISPIFGMLNYYIAKDLDIARSLTKINSYAFLVRYALVLVGLVLIKKNTYAYDG